MESMVPLPAAQDMAGLVNAAPDAMVVVDGRGVVVLVNSRTEELFGYARDELVGRPVELLLPSALRDSHAIHRQRYAAEPVVRAMGTGLDLKGRRKDGSEFRVEISLGPVHARSGILTCAVVRDVSARHDDELLFRGLLEAAPDAMVIVDTKGTIRLVNAQVESMFGYTRSELVGAAVEVLVPERFAGLHLGYRAGYMGHATRRPMGQSRQLWARRKDGAEFPVEIALSPLMRAEGTLVSAAIRDVSDRLRFEESAALYRAKDQFFATVSHELRTPLTSILGYGELLTEVASLPEQAVRFINVMMQNASRELRLVDDLLTLVEIEHSGVSFESREVDLTLIVRDCVEVRRPRALELGLEIDVESGPGSLHVAGDPVRLGRAVDNLLSNALKFSPRGGAVRVSLTRQGDQARLEVHDSGPGIAPEERLLVFDRLYRSPWAVQQQVPGAGLGLSIARALVLAHDGDLFVADSATGGTCMVIQIPVVDREGT